MITSIRLQNFKGHRDTTVPLGRFTVLVGPNGAGKTSVLEALAIQSRLARESADEVFAADRLPVDICRRGGDAPLVIRTSGASENSASRNVDWSAETKVTLSRDPASWKFDFDWKSGDEGLTGTNRSQSFQRSVPRVHESMGVATLYKLSARSIAAAAYSDSAEPHVGYDGTNTAVALAAIKLGQDEDFARLEQGIRAVIPNVERVRIKPATVRIPIPRTVHPGAEQDVIGNKVFFDFRGAPNVPAHLASEGTLITLAILTVLHGPNRPNVLLLDDFDQSLHPQAQIEMVRLLKRLLDQFHDVQIVATTHSPYILDELSPEDVVVFALRADGTVATKSLSEHPQAAKMKDALSAGQLWSLDHEADWVPDEATAAQ